MNRKIVAHSCAYACGIGVLAFSSMAAAQLTVTVGVPVGQPSPPPPPPPPPPATPHETILSRFSSSVRLNYGVPLGNVAEDEALGDAAGALYHVEWGGDFLLLPQLMLGVHAGVGVASLGNKFSQGCNADGVSCSLLDFDVGVHGEYLFLPVTAPITPWAGLGLTYEVLAQNAGTSDGSSAASVSAGGVDVDFSAGLDFNFPRFQIGPVVTLRAGKYTSVDETVNGVDLGSSDIGATDWHEWLMLGVRGRYWLGQ